MYKSNIKKWIWIVCSACAINSQAKAYATDYTQAKAYATNYTQATGYTQDPYLATELWEELSPFFLPIDHPIKPELDQIFNESRATQSIRSLKDAGFKLVVKPRQNHTLVVKHSKLKGYLIKLFTDDTPIALEWTYWKKRILGAHYIREAIIRNQAQHIFKVPQKWIYPLPHFGNLTEGSIRKYFVLVVEDMRLLKREKNSFFWRSVAITPQHLQVLHAILQQEGLIDSIYPSNIPFSRDRKIAFIDTEHWHHWPVPFFKLAPFLSFKMSQVWEKL